MTAPIIQLATVNVTGDMITFALDQAAEVCVTRLFSIFSGADGSVASSFFGVAGDPELDDTEPLGDQWTVESSTEWTIPSAGTPVQHGAANVTIGGGFDALFRVGVDLNAETDLNTDGSGDALLLNNSTVGVVTTGPARGRNLRARGWGVR